MSVQLTIDDDIKSLSRWLSKTQKEQLPSAIRNALNDTAYDTMKYMRNVLPKYIDRPTPFTIKSLQYEKTDKVKLVSKVGFTSLTFGKPTGKGSAHYMKLLIEGGVRYPNKRMIPVPTLQYKTNQYGNIGRGKITSLLGKKNHFQGTLNGKAGVFKTTGRGKSLEADMVIAYEKQTRYKPQFNFPTITKRAVNKLFKPSFEKNLNEVLRKKNLHGIRGWL